MANFGRFLLALLFLSAGGCVTRGNVELLESELRQHEDQVHALHMQLAEADSDLTIARKELRILRDQLAEEGELDLLPEQAESLYRVEGVRVNKFFTGGLDRDGEPGDDLLTVVLAPYDKHGETVKLPGALELEAIDLTNPGSARSLGVWRYSAQEVADHWQSGLTSGFQFRMPWHKLPTSPHIVLHARYATVDGRRFGTSEEIKVDPIPNLNSIADAETPKADAPDPTRIDPNPFAMETEQPIDQTGAESSPVGSSKNFELDVSDQGEQKPLLLPEPKPPADSIPESSLPLEMKPDQSALPQQFPAEPLGERDDFSSTSHRRPTGMDSIDWAWKSRENAEEAITPANHETQLERQDDDEESPTIDRPPRNVDDTPQRYQRSGRVPD